METYEDYVNHLIKEGFIKEDGTPLKCLYCEGNDFERRNEYYCPYGIEEYEVWCVKCNKKVGHWAFGTWVID